MLAWRSQILLIESATKIAIGANSTHFQYGRRADDKFDHVHRKYYRIVNFLDINTS